MNAQTLDQDLRLLLRSRYPIVRIDTVEEERAREVILASARELGLPCFTWSRTTGISRADNASSVYDTEEPDAALRHIQVADIDAVWILADFHPYLNDPLVSRRMRELAASLRCDRRAIVLLGSDMTLPPELLRDSVPFQVSLPDEAELRAALKEVLAGYLAEGQVIFDHEDTCLGASWSLRRALESFTFNRRCGLPLMSLLVRMNDDWKGDHKITSFPDLGIQF